MRTLNVTRLAEEIEKRATADLEACNIGGCAVLVVQNGKPIYRNCFSTSDGRSTPVTENTLFRLASMTKPITAGAVMILVERGLLSLDTTVDSFYPAFAFMQVRGESGAETVCGSKITVEHILTHTSGIGSGDVWVDAVPCMTSRDVATIEDFISFLSKQPLSYVPGTKQEYSAVGAFSVLTGIVEKITSIPYGEFFKKEIFEPCGMHNTTFAPSAEQCSRVIPMHDKIDGACATGKTYEGCVFEFLVSENHPLSEVNPI